MSGICGLVSPTGAEVDPLQLSRMTDVLQRRGPEGTHHWTKAAVALGHTLLATTPEAAVETLPLIDEETGCVITADLRLDNRDVLLPKLNLDHASRVIGDGELVLRAYLRWGEACVDHLLGDFAFAIWDPRHTRLFCARDHFGVKQLIYCHMPGSVFAFATEPRAILALDAISKVINEGRIADFLERGLEGIDRTSTFFEGVFRLPQAHVLTLDETGLKIWRYWTLTPGPELKLASNEAYAAAFREVFSEAVRCRLRSCGPVGSMLSGGLDSSSVSVVANELLASGGLGPLPTFSGVGPVPETCFETRAARAVQAQPGFDPHEVDYSDLGDMGADLEALTRQIDEPFDGHMMLPRAMYLSAKRAGVKVVLDGVGSDILLTSGPQIDHLIKSGRWRQALQDAQGTKWFWRLDEPVWRIMARATWRAWVPWRLRHAVRAVIGNGPELHSRGSILKPDFARRIDIADRWKTLRSHKSDRWMSHAQVRAQTISEPFNVVARERYDRVASALAIEPRDPFFDVRVIAFCLSLPPAQLSEDGWSKLILRRAMINRLPEAALWRSDHTGLGGSFNNAVFGAWPHFAGELDAAKELFSEYICLSDELKSCKERRSMSHADIDLVHLLCWWRLNC